MSHDGLIVIDLAKDGVFRSHIEHRAVKQHQSGGTSESGANLN